MEGLAHAKEASAHKKGRFENLTARYPTPLDLQPMMGDGDSIQTVLCVTAIRQDDLGWARWGHEDTELRKEERADQYH